MPWVNSGRSVLSRRCAQRCVAHACIPATIYSGKIPPTARAQPAEKLGLDISHIQYGSREKADEIAIKFGMEVRLEHWLVGG